jgi:pilus assembly protein CpaB
MNTARIVVLTIAVGAGGVAAYLASGSDNKPPAEPVARLQTVDVLVAKSGIGLGQSVTPEDLQWQTWPASAASNSFIRRNERLEATTRMAGSIARAPFIAGEPIRATETRSDDQAPKRSNAINVVRYGISSPTTTQK